MDVSTKVYMLTKKITTEVSFYFKDISYVNKLNSG